jgi:hypothetical protein
MHADDAEEADEHDAERAGADLDDQSLRVPKLGRDLAPHGTQIDLDPIESLIDLLEALVDLFEALVNKLETVVNPTEALIHPVAETVEPLVGPAFPHRLCSHPSGQNVALD